MIIRKLTGLPYADAHIEVNDGLGDIYLFVSCLLVATIRVDGNGEQWLYIHDNREQAILSAFGREYANVSLSSINAIYRNNYWLNGETGEVKEYI